MQSHIMKAAQYTIISAGIAAFATTRKMHLIVNRVYTTVQILLQVFE